ERYKTLMEKAGNRCDLKLYDGQGHGFFNASKNNGIYFLKTVREADLFLESLGYIKGAPTIETFSTANHLY
ncbi:MAG: hypothetical protein J7M12_02800, partial [Candidatus Hydrogenedentes bacterium]|nr:hypothetical protein [Candidatus Hydrogenedentota bacterium]